MPRNGAKNMFWMKPFPSNGRILRLLSVHARPFGTTSVLSIQRLDLETVHS